MFLAFSSADALSALVLRTFKIVQIVIYFLYSLNKTNSEPLSIISGRFDFNYQRICFCNIV